MLNGVNEMTPVFSRFSILAALMFVSIKCVRLLFDKPKLYVVLRSENSIVPTVYIY